MSKRIAKEPTNKNTFDHIFHQFRSMVPLQSEASFMMRATARPMDANDIIEQLARLTQLCEEGGLDLDSLLAKARRLYHKRTGKRPANPTKKPQRH